MDSSKSPPDTVSLTAAHRDDVHALLEGRHGDPFRVLGPHVMEADGMTIVALRVFLPGAESVQALVAEGEAEGAALELTRTDPAGFFEGVFPGTTCPTYRLRATIPGGTTWDYEDPYRFGSFISDHDLHLFNEGSLLRSYEQLGAHLLDVCGIKGVHFAVWAPNADRVSVVGDFNSWDGRRHPMRILGTSGCWEIFVPGVTEGDLYKFEIRTNAGDLRLKADPYGFQNEYRPGTSTIVADVGAHSYSWGDSNWMSDRAGKDWLREPVSIYEVHLGSWMRVPEEGDRFLTYRELAPRLVDYVKDLGFTHIELLPIQEHPLDESWGYQATGFFAPTSRYGTPRDFMYFVDHCHQNGIGVLLDWVPAHFPKDDHSLRVFDGTHLYEHEDPRQGEHKDWGTLIFNYGRNEVKSFLLSSAIYWLDRYHLDGLRVDAVASMLYLDYSKRAGEWVPNQYGGKENLDAIEFIKRLNYECHRYFPGILTIAEESTAWPGVSHPTDVDGLGFSMKWNMGWMNDTLSYFQKDPLFRKYHHQNLTFSLLYAFTENFVLPLSHDEVVHGKRSLIDKMPGDVWQKFANLRLLLGFQYCHPGKKLLFMGSEFGMGLEWSATRSLDWYLLNAETELHRGTQRFVRDVNRVYREVPALHQIDFGWQGFEWIDFRDWQQSVVAFRRRSDKPKGEVVVVFNFTPEMHTGYRLGVPDGGEYEELLNSDASEYCGSGSGNLGRISTQRVSSHGCEHSLSLTVPPLSLVVLRRIP